FFPAQESKALLDRIAQIGSLPQAVRAQAFIAYEDIPGTLTAVSSQVNGLPITEGGNFAQLAFATRLPQPDNTDIHNTNIEPRVSVSWDPWNNGKTKFSASAGKYYDKIFLAIPLSEVEPVHVQDFWTSNDVKGQGASLDPTYSTAVVDRNLKT